MDKDLISRSKLIKTLNEGLEFLKLNQEIEDSFIKRGLYALAIMDVETTISFMNDAPAVDAVEVVRCEECVYKQAPEEYGDLMCGMLKVPMKSNDFCSYGERMVDHA